MKTIINIINTIDLLLTRWTLSYIHKVSKTLYPRPHLDSDEEEDDDDEPVLFI